MKDLGVADVILGIRIHSTPQGLALSQSRYIKNVLDKFKYMEFSIAKTPLDVSFALREHEGYSDANYITGSNEVKFTSGYVFIISGGEVSWKSSKQTCIACSTMESEFIALDKVGEEAKWLWNFLEDIPYWPKPVAPYDDAQAAIVPTPMASHEKIVNDPNLFVDCRKNFHILLSTNYTVPVIGGKEIDLHVLYVEVTKRGGFY
ncbi:hypothetical protein T459_31022 [Capsicum annuum]|uniref:ARID domain-containing protein n=1 Tax=Capsicum annuum TaxID=4072 RepID=A0A2G2YA21_CAPAN|nr:hypothetical protein T459_31022 [Capsicum annuum]